MLSENEYVNTEIQNKGISKVIMVDYICPKCGAHMVLNADNIENHVESDPHDPLDDYIQCCSCENMENLRTGVNIKELRGRTGLLFADGSFIYVKLGEKVYRLA